MSASPAPILDVREISKRFPGVKALDRVSLEVRAGEVLALVGENGAGKSTLMKILAGIYSPDQGKYRIDGSDVTLGGVADALRLGVSLIHQELNLAENLSVAANLFLGREKLGLGWLLRRKAMEDASRALMDQVGLACSPRTIVGDLPPGQRQLVEIAHALAMQARVLIMDEPTSSLTQGETEKLFALVKTLRQRGVAIVYISHRLGEVEELADRAVVLRDGKNVGELPREQIGHAALVRLMVGRELGKFYARKHKPRDGGVSPRLEVHNLRYVGGPKHEVSFSIRQGEVVGMAGLIGAGRTELAEAIFGIRKVAHGSLLLDGAAVRIANPRQAIARGVLLVPEDRRQHGLVLEENVQRNIGLANLDRLNRLRLVRQGRERALAQSMVERLRIRTPGLWQKTGLLSGGNQQKVVLGKWLGRDPRVLIFDEPTRGIDVGAKSEIYALMDELAGQGVGILMISSDLEEVIGMSDRVLVLHEGRLAGELPRDQLGEEAIMHLATGGSKNS